MLWNVTAGPATPRSPPSLPRPGADRRRPPPLRGLPASPGRAARPPLPAGLVALGLRAGDARGPARLPDDGRADPPHDQRRSPCPTSQDLAEERGSRARSGVADRRRAPSANGGPGADRPRHARPSRSPTGGPGRCSSPGAATRSTPRCCTRTSRPVLARRRGAGGLPPLDRPGPAHGRQTARGRGRGAAARGSPPGRWRKLLPGYPDAPEVDVVRAQNRGMGLVMRDLRDS